MRTYLTIGALIALSACSAQDDAEESNAAAPDSDAQASGSATAEAEPGQTILPSGGAVKGDLDGTFSRNGGTVEEPTGYTCIMNVTDAKAPLPEDSIHYEEVSFSMKVDDLGCTGNIDTSNAPKSIEIETTQKVSDGLGSVADGFGQTKFDATATLDGKPVSAIMTCTAQMSEKYHEMTCQFREMAVGDVLPDDPNPQDAYNGIATVFFVR
ncbi:MAG: hypothetical protein AAF127_14390 [Pseudomonadota bacterium]